MSAKHSDAVTWVKAPACAELTQLTHTIVHRLARYLERYGMLVRDAEHSYLALEGLDEDPMDQLRGHSITYRIALGPNKAVKFSPCKRCLMNAILRVRFWPRPKAAARSSPRERPLLVKADTQISAIEKAMLSGRCATCIATDVSIAAFLHVVMICLVGYELGYRRVR